MRPSRMSENNPTLPMSQIFMMTVPRTVHKKILKIMIAENDVKRWVIGWETGHGGYEHYQIRLETSNPDFFHWLKTNMPTAHTELSKTWSNYESKEGYYIDSRDSNSIRAVRFGKPTSEQKAVLQWLKCQSDRQIDVWLDKKGNHGKSWLSVHLWERGNALIVPRSAVGSGRTEGFICDAFDKRWYDIVIVDIPRGAKPPKDIYETLEEIKDGIVSDWRYNSRQINIRGCKVAVFTNQTLDLKMLSDDRWRLHAWGDPMRSLSS